MIKEYFVAKLQSNEDKEGWIIDPDLTETKGMVSFDDEASEEEIVEALVSAGYVDSHTRLWLEEYDDWISDQDNCVLYVRDDYSREYLFTISTFDGRK